MNPLILAPVLELGKELIDRFIPNKTEAAAAELELVKITQEQNFKAMIAQLEINAKEAAHPSIFVAGWRPFIGWIGGFGLLYAAVLHNVIVWVAYIKGWPVPPAVDTDTLIYVVSALLGIGTMRSIEKTKGVTK